VCVCVCVCLHCVCVCIVCVESGDVGAGSGGLSVAHLLICTRMYICIVMRVCRGGGGGYWCACTYTCSYVVWCGCLYTFRAGLDRTYVHYITGYFMNSLQTISYMHHVYDSGQPYILHVCVWMLRYTLRG
jgi:hypothetical protein